MSIRSSHACLRAVATAVAVLVAWLPVAAGAVTIAFEGVAAEASLEPVTPSAPYTESGVTFDLTSVLIGPSSLGGGLVDISIDGVLDGGGTLDASFLGLTTATTANLSWTGLTSVTIATTDDAGLDDLLVVPEPGTLALVALGVAALAFGGRHRSR